MSARRANPMALNSNPHNYRTGRRAPINILDLPDEILKEICGQCHQADWVCLALVCKRFRDLAAAQLYRNFHIVFPDEDDHYFDSPIDGLAGGLETFVTSDYNYAKHLRELSLDTLSIGERAETAYKSYLASVSCGKFMNTLLLLTLRKARSLDTFRWNIRVELSRAVYKALHGIKSLRHLHLRLQAGPSLYQPPPPLTSSNSYYTGYDVDAGPTIWTNAGGALIAPVTIYGPLTGTIPTIPPPDPKPSGKNRSLKRSSDSKEPPTIAGFKTLESLGVLDIDSLDVIPEIQACIRNSSSTLRKMKLSFSSNLAMQARKPYTDTELDESEDDEFQVGPISPTADYEDNGPAKAFRAQEARKAQESVLGRIFEVEPPQGNSHVAIEDKKEDEKKDDTEERPTSDEGQQFINEVNRIFQRMMAHVNGTSNFTSLDQQNALETIAKAAKKYVNSEESKAKSNPSAQDMTNDGEFPSSSKEPEPGPNADGFDELQPPEVGLKAYPSKPKDPYDANPDDIDIEVPEEQLATELQPGDDTGTADILSSKGVVEASRVSATPCSAPKGYSIAQVLNAAGFDDIVSQCEKQANGLTNEIRVDIRAPDFDDRMREAKRRLESLDSGIEELVNKANAVTADAVPSQGPVHSSEGILIDTPTEGLEGGVPKAQIDLESVKHDVDNIFREINSSDERAQNESAQTIPIEDGKGTLISKAHRYARDTRGIGLHSLSLHLVPIKASVLGKAIDLHVLKRITLLNVGEQKKFWAMMIKENNLKPLPLRKVFTDDVCLQFLQLVSQLECVKEVFMLQRSPKHKPESFAPNPGTTIEQIRNFVLKKHLRSLKRLMIKNQADGAWDVDEKTIQLICRHGKMLEELAVIMGMRAIHALIQRIAGLVNLRALQLVTFRTEDACHSVVRETRRFIVDALCYHPELKLEWLALGDDERAVRIVRKMEAPKKQKSSSKKGKEPVIGSNYDHTSNGFYPVAPVEWDASSASEDDDGDDLLPRVDLEVLEPFAFYDVFGIRIFKKEIANGQL